MNIQPQDGQAESLCWGAVVINFNGGEKVIECVSSVLRQDIPPTEVVLVDSASSDGSETRVATVFPTVRILRLTENRGPSVARNIGMDALKADLALLVDGDIYLSDDTVRHLLCARRRHRATVACPRIRLLPEREIVQADGAEAHFTGTLALRHGFMCLPGAAMDSALVGAVPGGCLLVDRFGVLAAGGFDELYFFYAEDLEFSLRLRALGHYLAWAPMAIVYHDRGEGTPGLAFRGRGHYPMRRAYLNSRNRLLTIFIHFRLRTVLVLAPVLLAYEAAALTLALLRGWLPVWGRAWAWQLHHAPEIRARRRRMQRTRVVADREILTGGPIPLAPGLLRSPTSGRVVAVLSFVLDAYWRCARHLIG